MIFVKTSEIVAHSLSMPHSPRLCRDKLWLHNSGTGELGTVEIDSGRFETVAFASGGLSKPRDNKTFSGSPLEERLKEKNAEAKYGHQIINLKIGVIVNWVKIEGVVEELYDIVALPEARRPMALGFKTDEIRHMLTVGEKKKIELIQCFIGYSQRLYV